MATALDTRLQAKTLSPILTVDDLQKSIAFFEGLGFGVEDRWEEHGTLLGVMLRAGTSRIGLSQDDWKKGRGRRKGEGMRIYIDTAQNIDQVAADAKKAGIVLDAEPHDSDMGRAFEVTEPSGFKLTIGSESARSLESMID
jgi:predicted enzyme related to lactoylglutathione lyase